MDQLLQRKTLAFEAAVWPFNRPADAYEPPLWQSICREWVDKVMKPVFVTYLIEELRGLSDISNEESTSHDIDKAIEASGNWQEVVEGAGWRDTESVISEISSGAEGSEKLLIRLFNMALHGDTSEILDDDNFYYWIRKSPEWEDDTVVLKPALIPWDRMSVGNAEARQQEDAQIENEFKTAPEYELCHVAEKLFGDGGLAFSEKSGVGEEWLNLGKDAQLPSEFFKPATIALATCREAMVAWLIYEWLEPHSFVNTEAGEWSSRSSWQEVGKDENLGDEVTRNEIGAWYIVSETAGEHLKEIGEVVAPLNGSSYFLWGRDEGGQVLHFDGSVQRAMIRSGYLDRIPPVGFLERTVAENISGLRVTLGGEDFPFRLEGYSAVNAVKRAEDENIAQSILMTLVRPDIREAGWGVAMGPGFESDMLGVVCTFRLVDPRELMEEEKRESEE